MTYFFNHCFKYGTSEITYVKRSNIPWIVSNKIMTDPVKLILYLRWIILLQLFFCVIISMDSMDMLHFFLIVTVQVLRITFVQGQVALSYKNLPM